MEESPQAKEYRQRYKLKKKKKKAREWIFSWKRQPSGPILDFWRLELYENKHVLL